MSTAPLDQPPVDQPSHSLFSRFALLWALLRRGDVWASLPAVLAAGFVLAAVSASNGMSGGQLAAFYRRTAGEALTTHDFATARVCFERLTRLEPAPDAWYGLARSVEGLGEHDRAERLLNRAAPADRAGYAWAHLERAKALLAATPRTPAAVADAERHLRSALATAPHLAAANALLGRLYMATGRPGSAVRHLKRAVAEQPELRMALARAHLALEEVSIARQEAELALKEWRRRATAHPAEYEARAGWAEAALFLGDYAAAVEAFEQQPIPAGDPRFGKSLAVLYTTWSDAAVRDRGADGLADRVVLLERGLRADPANAPLLNRLAQVLREGGADADRAREVLRDLLARGKATAPAHFTLGVDAWLRGDLAQARVHFEEADRLAPGGAQIVNNLAWVVAHGKPPDLPRALKLIELALERSPDVPSFRGTRGVILAGLGRWRDALPDLEVALADSPDNVELHHSLASAYESLGDKDMAARHRLATVAGPQKPSRSPAPPVKLPVAGGTDLTPAAAPTEPAAPNPPPSTSDPSSSPR